MRPDAERQLEETLRPILQAWPVEKLEGLPEAYGQIITEYQDAGRRALCRVDRYYLLTCELSRPDAASPWLYQRCREVEAEPDGHLDLWAREHYKSTIITFAGSIQEILIDPEITIGIFSHTAPIAKKFLAQIKGELETNVELQALFPDILWSRPDRDSPLWSVEKGITVRRASNPKEATVEAHGLVDSQPIGAHFRLLVYDDVVVPASVTSPEMVKKTTEMHALSDNLGARGADGMKRKWHIGTRYSFADTYGDLIERGALKQRIHPATHDGTVDGHPVFLSPEAWARCKIDQTSSVLAAQMLQNPAAGNEALFAKDQLRFADVRPGTLNVYIMADPASSRKKGSDNTAIPVVGIDAGDNWYLLDGYCHKMKLSERWQRIRDLRRRWLRVPGVQMVKVGYERFGLDDALEYFEERMRIEGESFEIQELAWPREGPGSKYDRVQRLEPKFRAGKFYLAAALDRESRAQRTVREHGQEHRIFAPPRAIDHQGEIYRLNRVFINEFLTFPFSRNDDLIDAVSRTYDMDPRPPVIVDQTSLEPEVFADGA